MAWSGNVEGLFTEATTFEVETSAGVRLTVGGNVIIDQLANSLGTANSSGSGASGSGANTGTGVTTGSARSAPGGVNATGPQTKTDGDAAIEAENRTLDRKIKSICKGC